MAQNPRENITVQGRTISIGDLTKRTDQLRSMIQEQEMAMHQLQHQRTSLSNDIFMARMRTIQTEIDSRRESLDKIMTLIKICRQQGNNGGPANVGDPSQGTPLPGNTSGKTTQPPASDLQATPDAFYSSDYLPIDSAINAPPRSNPIPQNTFPMDPWSNLNAPIAPLDQSRFETSYTQWCLTKAIVHDPRLLSINSRQIDLYQLHCHVMREGGIANVTRKELWPVIGGRLNIVHYPGSATEPPKSGPAAAMHIQHVYKEYLFAFDTVYMASVMDSRRKAAGFLTASQLSGQLPGEFSPGGLSMPFTLETLPHMNPTQLRMIIMCADKSVPELRARGWSENMIDFVETHRSTLQGMGAEQESFGNELRRQPPGPPLPLAGQLSGKHSDSHFTGSAFSRPTREQISIAQLSINKLKTDYTARVLPLMPTIEIPPESRVEYNNILEMVFRSANDLDNKLPIYSAATKNEENTRNLLSTILSVQHQRSLLASASPKYISFETLRVFSNNLQNAHRQIHTIIQTIVKAGEQHPGSLSTGSPFSGPTRSPFSGSTRSPFSGLTREQMSISDEPDEVEVALNQMGHLSLE